MADFRTNRRALRAARNVTRQKQRREGKDSLGRDIGKGISLAEKYDLLPGLGSVDATRPGETTGLINSAQSAYQASLSRDPAQAQLLAQLQGGQGGLTTTENTALRENAEAGLESQLQTALRTLGIENAGRGAFGGTAQAGALDLLRGRAEQQRGIERDIIGQNIALKESRQQRLGDFLSDLVGGESERQRGALSDVSGLTAGAQARQDALEQYNLEQEAREQANRNSVIFGLAGAAGNRRARRRAERLAARQIAAEGNARTSEGNAGI